jgi:hypothetical protein
VLADPSQGRRREHRRDRRAFDDPSFKLIAVIPAMDDADNLRIDTVTNHLYVGYGDGALGLIDPATMKRLDDIKLPGHPESFRLEHSGPRIYVNVPRTKESWSWTA